MITNTKTEINWKHTQPRKFEASPQVAQHKCFGRRYQFVHPWYLLNFYQIIFVIECWYVLNTNIFFHNWFGNSARFTYRLDRLKPRASKLRGAPTKVYNIFNTVIGLSHLCCHNVLYFLKQPFSNFPYTVAVHFRILQNCKYPSSSSPLLKLISTLPSSSSHEGGELEGTSQVE